MERKELQKILDTIKERYETELVPIGIHSKNLRVLTLKDIDEVTEKAVETPVGGKVALLYWGRIWEASLVLASFIGEQNLRADTTVLELGCGIGVTGLFLAAWGHRVVLTDINEDALLFANANIHLNDLGDRAQALKLDWRNPTLKGQFDYVIGSEIVYERDTYPAIIDVLRRYLKPMGTIYMSEGVRPVESTFYSLLEPYFRYEKRKLVMHTDDERHRVSIYTIRWK